MIELGSLGLGTAPLAGLYEPVDDDTAHAVVERAWELGIRYFDTAPYYGSGLAERRLGTALSGKPRDEYVVSTKVGRLLEPGASDWHGAYFDFSYDGALRSLEQSLVRLELDRVDIALVHDPDDHYDEAVAGAYRALTRAARRGRPWRDRRRHEPDARCCAASRARRIPTASSSQAGTRCSTGARPKNCFRSAWRRASPSSRAASSTAACSPAATRSTTTTAPARRRHAGGGPARDVRELRRSAACGGGAVPARHPAVASVLVGCRTPEEVEEDVRLFALDLPEELWEELG